MRGENHLGRRKNTHEGMFEMFPVSRRLRWDAEEGKWREMRLKIQLVMDLVNQAKMDSF